jgi:hypothetical protein
MSERFLQKAEEREYDKLTANPLFGRFIPGDVMNERTEEIP